MIKIEAELKLKTFMSEFDQHSRLRKAGSFSS